MDRIELLRKLIEQEPLVRWSAVATAALAWLSVAWFSPLPLLQMSYTNRPSGIQQVISFDGP